MFWSSTAIDRGGTANSWNNKPYNIFKYTIDKENRIKACPAIRWVLIIPISLKEASLKEQF